MLSAGKLRVPLSGAGEARIHARFNFYYHDVKANSSRKIL